MKKEREQRLKAGIKRMKEKKILILIPMVYVEMMFFMMFVLKKMLHKLRDPYSEKIFEIVLYIFFCEMIVVGIFEIIQMFGSSFFSKRIESALVEIGFVDKEGQAPILLSKKKENKGIIYEFYSRKIPFYKYKDHRAEIETALNIRIIDVMPGKDMQHIFIKAVKGNGGKQDMILWNDAYLSDKDFELVIGESYFGIESINISTIPHVLIGGGSGSGKTKLLKLLLMESIKKQAYIFLADFKGGVDYPEVWHEACSIITEPEDFNNTLKKILMILEDRRSLFVKSKTSNITEYNKKTGVEINRIIIACDEIAEVLDKTGLDKEQKTLVNQIEAKISTIARMGRAFGIHLFLATQRPSADLLSGQIKNNIGYRICGRADKVLSQIILDNSDAADKISPNDQGVFLANTGILFKAYYIEDDFNIEISDEKRRNIN